MALEKIRVIAILFLAVVCSIGCSGDGTFERPDVFEVTTPEAVHGQVGYRADVMMAEEGEALARQLVLVLQDSDVSGRPIYVVMGYTSGAPHSTNQNTLDAVALIDYLHASVSVDLVPSLPKGTTQKGGITYGGSTFLCYLQVTTPSDTLYWSVRSSPETMDGVLAWLTTPPKVLDTGPATVIEISYYSDPDLTEPLTDSVLVGDTIYTKVVFSKDVPIVFADDDRARPVIALSGVGRESPQFRMKPPGTSNEHLQSGDAKPYQNTKHTFICKYVTLVASLGHEIQVYTESPFMLGDPLLVKPYVHTDSVPENVGETITDWQPSDFVGQVFSPTIGRHNYEGRSYRSGAPPVAGVTVTIVAGPRAGESTLTDKNGRYRFSDVEADELHLLVEREHLEPKEVIVHRSRPTMLPGGGIIDYSEYGDPQRRPGNILMGQAWPDEVRFILEETLVVPDLLYIGGFSTGGVAGLYSEGLVLVLGGVLTTAHEIAHAHQHALVFGGRYNWGDDWINTPEAKAFAAAKERDWAEVGKTGYDSRPHFRSLWENAAETSAHYWSIGTEWEGENIEEIAPNRFRWAEEWLKKK